MAGNTNVQKLTKTIKIFAVAQVGLVAMLVYMAILFQGKFRLIGRPEGFMYSVILSFLVQLTLIYPLFKFSGNEAERDLALTSGSLTPEELKALTKKKRMSDIIKGSVFFFFAMFILQAPGIPLILSVLYFTFVLTILTYLQCYNFAAKKLMRQDTGSRH